MQTGSNENEALRPSPRRLEKRHDILSRAVTLASVEGLEGMSIGRLAEEVGMTKSGLFAHFGSKTGLELATIEEALSIYGAAIFEPAWKHPSGVPRLDALFDSWAGFLESRPFPGGCFFESANAECDARSGPIQERLKEIGREWLLVIEKEFEAALEMGELQASASPSQLAFRAMAAIREAERRRQLLGDEKAFDLARAAIRGMMLESLSSDGLRAWWG